MAPPSVADTARSPALTPVCAYTADRSATIFGRSESLRFSPYLQDCIRHLEASEEYETDAILAFIVRMQHLTERIFDLNARDKTAEEAHLVPPAPTLAYVHAFQHELDRMRNSLPPSLRTDGKNNFILQYSTLWQKCLVLVSALYRHLKN